MILKPDRKLWTPPRSIVMPRPWWRQRGFFGFFMPMPMMPSGKLVSISADTTNYDLFAALGSPVNSQNVTVTIETGVYVYSTSVSTPGFDLGTGWAAGSKVKIINNGFILGKGGNGAGHSGGNPGSLVAPTAGGTALKAQANCALTVDNTSYIAGGGGGGGGMIGDDSVDNLTVGGGGGAGGGDGGNTFRGTNQEATGGAGGGVGAAGSNGSTAFFGTADAGAGGGRILPGSGGAGFVGDSGAVAVGGGAGGGGGGYSGMNYGDGGTGGSANSVGGNAVTDTFTFTGGGGGGWGAAGGNPAMTGGFTVSSSQNGAAGGKAVDLNGQSVAWVATGTRYGAIA